MIRAENISKSFGGLDVLTGLSFELQPQEKVALIGPNGAGKSTLINVLSGLLPVSGGQVLINDQDVTEHPLHHRVSHGLARSFQLNSLFGNLDLLSNILLAIQGAQSRRYSFFRSMFGHRENLDRARELLQMVELWDERYSPANALSYGQQRQVEIIMTMASDPKIMLLDEPTAGLTAGESSVLSERLKTLTKDATVLFSAHDLDLVFNLADRVIVLHGGGLVAQGTPDEIQNNQRVQEIYLGVEGGVNHA